MTGFRRAILLGLIGALLMSIMVVSAVTNTNLGTSYVRMARQTFSDDADVVVTGKRIFKIRNADTAAAVGDSAPGVEITSGMPAVNNTLNRNKYAYQFEVKETGGDTLGSGENLKIEVYMDDGSTSTLLATLYTQQSVLEGATVEGVTVTVDTGQTKVGDTFSIVITRQ